MSTWKTWLMPVGTAILGHGLISRFDLLGCPVTAEKIVNLGGLATNRYVMEPA